MQNTAIGWTERSSNPIRVLKEDGKLGGHWCRKHSPGCASCYAEAINHNPYFSFASFLPYTGEPPKLKLDRKRLKSWTRATKTELVFVGTMTDIFGDWVPRQWHLEIFRAAQESKLVFQFLTKRPEIMLDAVLAWMEVDNLQTLPSNIWWGTTVELTEFKSRLDYLRQIPGAVRFVSFEPLLGELGILNLDKIDWGIIGGESKSKFHPHPRPCHLEWLDKAARQFPAWNVPLYVKQLGSNPYVNGNPLQVKGKGEKLKDIPLNLRIRQYPIAFPAT